jgi:cupin fold WbuC family metalloprotein
MLRNIIKKYKIDNTGKTDALYFKKNSLNILDKKTLDDLIKLANKKKNNIRLCFHENKKSDLHSMVNIIFSKNNPEKYHKHIHKDEVYQHIKGSLEIAIIEKKKQKKIFLNKETIILRVPKNVFHKVKSISRYSVFHEIRKGPFNKNDSIFKKNNQK